MEIEQRCELLDFIDLFAESSNNSPSWMKKNCLKLLPFCKLQDIPKLCICHKAARENDDGVIAGRRTLMATDGEGEAGGRQRWKKHSMK
eukprot:418615-Ditylum_brightwellii.AAC.1